MNIVIYRYSYKPVYVGNRCDFGSIGFMCGKCLFEPHLLPSQLIIPPLSTLTESLRFTLVMDLNSKI